MVEKSKSADDIFSDSTKITDTPEFKAAVEVAANEAATRAVAAAMTAMKEGNQGVDPGTAELLRMMAMNIADLSYQGNKRDKPLDPRIVASREAAHARLDALLSETHEKVHAAREATYKDEDSRNAAIRRVSPRYCAVSKVNLAETMILPFRRDEGTKKMVPVEFFWLQEPNHAMRPLNDIARKIYAEFRESRGERSKIEKASVKPLWMTDRGLVIEGTNAPPRRNIDIPRDLDIPEFKDPEAPFINVLGTSHEPAQNNYQGKPL